VGVTGVNWTARMMGVKFLDSTFTGTVAGAINAIEFAIQANAAFANSSTPINVRVLNMSWGGLGFSQAFADEINKANANNMLLVAAAGNRNLDNDVNPYYPSSYNVPNIIAVASTDSNDNRTSWSDYGASTVHLAAPGENIY
jgi:subtilisin family serine protease